MASDYKRVFRDIKKKIKQLPNTFELVVKGKRGRIALRALQRISTEPGRPNYPLKWQTPRQRRAYFATDGFVRGIPSRRTGRQAESWSVEVVEGGLIAATNSDIDIVLRSDSPVTPFIQDEHVQRFHLDTGWVQVSDVEDEFFADSLAFVVKTFEDVAGDIFDE